MPGNLLQISYTLLILCVIVLLIPAFKAYIHAFQIFAFNAHAEFQYTKHNTLFMNMKISFEKGRI